MLKRLLFIIALAVAPTPGLSQNVTVRDRIISELRDDGYAEIRISRTLLGRLRFLATRSDARREIVVNPRTGVILRDYIRFINRSSSSGGDSDDDEDDDDYDQFDYDDERDDDYDDDRDDESDEGDDDESDDDDDDESDNSGSGSGFSSSDESDESDDD